METYFVIEEEGQYVIVYSARQLSKDFLKNIFSFRLVWGPGKCYVSVVEWVSCDSTSNSLFSPPGLSSLTRHNFTLHFIPLNSTEFNQNIVNAYNVSILYKH